MEGFIGTGLGFSFGNKHSSQFGITRTSNGDRYEKNLPQSKDVTQEIAGADGAMYFGSTYTKKEFNVPFAFEEMTEDQWNNFNTWIGDNKIHNLIFDEEPHKVWSAKVTGKVNKKYLVFDKHQKTLQENVKLVDDTTELENFSFQYKTNLQTVTDVKISNFQREGRFSYQILTPPPSVNVITISKNIFPNMISFLLDRDSTKIIVNYVSGDGERRYQDLVSLEGSFETDEYLFVPYYPLTGFGTIMSVSGQIEADIIYVPDDVQISYEQENIKIIASLPVSQNGEYNGQFVTKKDIINIKLYQSFPNITVYRGEGSINFTCYQPFARSLYNTKEEYPDTLSSYPLVLDTNTTSTIIRQNYNANSFSLSSTDSTMTEVFGEGLEVSSAESETALNNLESAQFSSEGLGESDISLEFRNTFPSHEDVGWSDAGNTYIVNNIGDLDIAFSFGRVKQSDENLVYAIRLNNNVKLIFNENKLPVNWGKYIIDTHTGIVYVYYYTNSEWVELPTPGNNAIVSGDMFVLPVGINNLEIEIQSLGDVAPKDCNFYIDYSYLYLS